MNVAGGCYCGAVRYKAEGEALFKGQCHCRECQYISGGSPVIVMGVGGDDFAYTQGEPRSFTRSDIESPVTREFCSNCGTHMTTKVPSMGGAVLLKVGTLDDPSVFGGPDMAIYTAEKQSWHLIPEGIPTFEHLPG
ncbi:MAG: GFA family protein [Deltaproteobacteria bacterium]|nr:GFA family protein [Deltaproteobacteria bacterium]MBW2360515.1 GFA family protein [Deltaproteobacteria bacterium]